MTVNAYSNSARRAVDLAVASKVQGSNAGGGVKLEVALTGMVSLSVVEHSEWENRWATSALRCRSGLLLFLSV